MRADAQLPLELQSLVQEVLVAREEQKLERPFCGYLKSFGVCRSLMRSFTVDPTVITLIISQCSFFLCITIVSLEIIFIF